MKFSVVIPVLNERACLPAAVASVRIGIPEAEIIACDGGSTDGSREWLLAQRDVTVLDSPRGKGPQQNAAAARAHGDVFLFLHADSQLPSDAKQRLERALSNTCNVGGCFFVRFVERTPLSLRILAFGMNIRAVLLKRCFGDHALFIRRAVFEHVGGFPEWPLFEDYELVRRMKRAGRFGVIPSPVTISARRFLERGVWRTVMLVFLLQTGFYFGVSPARLKRWFADIRPHLRQTAKERLNLGEFDGTATTTGKRSTGT